MHAQVRHGKLHPWPAAWAVVLLVFTLGCQQSTHAPPGGGPWRFDSDDIKDGGWSGGGTGTGGAKDDDGGVGTGSADTSSATRGDSDSEQLSEACPAGQGDRVLAVSGIYEIPLWLTGEDNVFTDLFRSPGDRLYFFNDRNYCEAILVAGVPDFDPESGSFCTSTPEWAIRGWTMHQGKQFVLDAKTRAVFTVFVSQEERLTYSLPTQLGNPTGLVSDGTGFWISDSEENELWRIDPEGADPQSRPSPGPAPASLTRAGGLLHVLHGFEVTAQTREGEICYVLGLTVELSGFAIDMDGEYAYGVAANNAIVYRFEL